jgi:hypothetical protein
MINEISFRITPEGQLVPGFRPERINPCKIMGLFDVNTECMYQICTYYGFHGKRREIFPAFAKEMGIVPKIARDQWNWGIRRDAGIPQKLWNACWMNMCVSELADDIVAACAKNKVLVTQLMADGQENLTPLILLAGYTPEEWKQQLGKGLWRQLANNSFSRNLLIATRAPIQCLKHSAHLPSTVLKNLNRHHRLKDSVLFWDALDSRLTYFPTYKAVNRYFDNEGYWVITDTIGMCLQTGITFNPKWSPNRMLEVHDELTKKLQLNQYPTHQLMDEHTVDLGEWQFTRLTSA